MLPLIPYSVFSHTHTLIALTQVISSSSLATHFHHLCYHAHSSPRSLSPHFSDHIYEYTVSLPNEVPSLSITATTQHALASIGDVNGVSLTSGVASPQFPVAENGFITLPVVITAQDGYTRTAYRIRVERACSTDATLSGLVPLKWSLSSWQRALSSSWACWSHGAYQIKKGRETLAF